ncbi:MAG: galactose mutarotase [Oscillospiraceae bacterium]|nr:galactose mutarotase [Oscillospiraceae bacterium]
MAIKFSTFGTLADGRTVTAAVMTNKSGASMTVLDYGATIQSLCIPDRDGRLTDVVLGYDTIEEYVQHGEFLGATIGRVGNRIGKAEFSLNGTVYRLFKNDGENHLHGGKEGFDRRLWRMAAQGDSLLCWRTSPDGEEGYPGSLQVRVCFTLTDENRLRIVYDADTDADTLVNLTNHSYFNLNGHGSVLDHGVQIFAERFAENDSGCLPTGRLLPVEGTPFDFRQEKTIGADIGADEEQLILAGGYDHNYVLCGKKAAVLYGPETGIEMTVETDMPGMQFYTGNFLPECKGKNGGVINKRYAACFETQLYPNAMNCYGFPSPVLRAGAHLHSETDYAFRVR